MESIIKVGDFVRLRVNSLQALSAAEASWVTLIGVVVPVKLARPYWALRGGSHLVKWLNYRSVHFEDILGWIPSDFHYFGYNYYYKWEIEVIK